MPKVIILGGGVAGMSAAHELAERGFQVEVYEHKHKYVGGKARSVNVPDTAKNGNFPLPGEHGFRFFPGFYKHVTDTMKRIPAPNGKSVYQNLVPTEHIMIARYNANPIEVLAHFPRSLKDLEFMYSSMHHLNTGLSKEEIEFFAARMWQLMTSCTKRRANEYERLGWAQYLQANRFSKQYTALLVDGLTRTLVAARADTASTKTGGDIFLQLTFNMIDPFVNTDRVLCGPTNDVWLNPWKEYLTNKLKVNYQFGATAKNIQVDKTKITGVDIEWADGKKTTVTGDYYLFAVPIEQLAPLLSKEVTDIDNTLTFTKELAKSVNWMNGMQFYLNEDVKVNSGHVICSDSQWAVTCISQVQFWRGFDISKYGDGKVKGILSVDISDWFTKGFNGKNASDCSRKEIKDEVWLQLKTSLNVNGKEILRDEMIVDWYIDRDIETGLTTQLSSSSAEGKDFNKEPLLVNTVNSWGSRPDSHCGIPNMFMACDAVRTYTDLATMEGANEAARRATNDIIFASGVNANDCKIWNLHEPWILKPFRWRDERRYEKGLPWNSEISFIAKVAVVFIFIGLWIFSLFKKK